MSSTTALQRRARTTLPLVVALAIAACGGGGGDTTNPINTGGGGGGGGGGGTTRVVTTSVTAQNTAFNPPDITVAPGATVTFTNADNTPHNATFDASAISGTGNIQSGSAGAVTMPTTPGTYSYHCTLHSGMNGSVQVQ